jgi:hypothetical protein
VSTWEVDIISMSFGCDGSVPEIEHEIDLAAKMGIVIFAAASNCGGNDSISWPACHQKIIPVYASRGSGNKYDRNPTPDPQRKNFAVVGTSLEDGWPAKRPDKRAMGYSSGTSLATPVAAGIAATIIQLMYTAKLEFLERRNPLRRDEEERYYERCIQSLKTTAGMEAVFALMSPRKRDDYDYVIPWELLGENDGDNWDTVHDIWKAQRIILDRRRLGKRPRMQGTTCR